MSEPFDELEALKREYAKTLPEKTKPIHTVVQTAIATLKTGKQPDWDAIESLTHKLAGSSGTYGFPKLSEICRDITDLIAERRIQAMPAPMAAKTLEDWHKRFSADTDVSRKEAA